MTDSWGKVVAITVAACLAVGALLWLVVPKGAPVKNAGAAADDQAAGATPAERAAAANKAVQGAVAGERRGPTRKERLEARLGKPPKLSVQVFDPLEGICSEGETFNVSLVVRVIRGEFDTVTAVVKVPFDKVTRTRTLMHSENEYTTTIGGLPANRTATLLVIGKGPNGDTTITKDITHMCPGGGLDKDDPNDLVGKDAAVAIREKMFDGEFEFDLGGAKN